LHERIPRESPDEHGHRERREPQRGEAAARPEHVAQIETTPVRDRSLTNRCAQGKSSQEPKGARWDGKGGWGIALAGIVGVRDQESADPRQGSEPKSGHSQKMHERWCPELRDTRADRGTDKGAEAEAAVERTDDAATNKALDLDALGIHGDIHAAVTEAQQKQS